MADSDGIPDLPEELLEALSQQAAEILLSANHVIALTGAGISAESGIPTFRGKEGLWTKHGEPPLNQYQDFITDPETWWERVVERRRNPDELSAAVREAVPNDGHFAMAELERLGVLKHIITQNIDNLHRLAGSEQITEIHGNSQWLRCLGCGTRAPFDEIPEQRPPRCDDCGSLVKTDTVMFGEPIPRDALETCIQEAGRADCMLLVGTTAVVSPAADFAWEIHGRGHPLIEVNLDPTVITDRCEVAIHGKAGEIMSRIVDKVKRASAK
jgi:NAD-dependent deacetylase